MLRLVVSLIIASALAGATFTSSSAADAGRPTVLRTEYLDVILDPLAQANSDGPVTGRFIQRRRGYAKPVCEGDLSQQVDSDKNQLIFNEKITKGGACSRNCILIIGDSLRSYEARCGNVEVLRGRFDSVDNGEALASAINMNGVATAVSGSNTPPKPGASAWAAAAPVAPPAPTNVAGGPGMVLQDDVWLLNIQPNVNTGVYSKIVGTFVSQTPNDRKPTCSGKLTQVGAADAGSISLLATGNFCGSECTLTLEPDFKTYRQQCRMGAIDVERKFTRVENVEAIAVAVKAQSDRTAAAFIPTVLDYWIGPEKERGPSWYSISKKEQDALINKATSERRMVHFTYNPAALGAEKVKYYEEAHQRDVEGWKDVDSSMPANLKECLSVRHNLTSFTYNGEKCTHVYANSPNDCARLQSDIGEVSVPTTVFNNCRWAIDLSIKCGGQVVEKLTVPLFGGESRPQKMAKGCKIGAAG